MDEITTDNFLIDTIETWSFSRLNSFKTCPYSWKLHYLEGVENENGFFDEYGSFCHKILEAYYKNEISFFDLLPFYEENFDNEIPHDAPPNKYTDIRGNYFEKGYNYFENFNSDLGDWEILGVEKKVNFEIAGKKFVGYIDLLLKNTQTGEIKICDHKSASIKIKKDGTISKSDQEHFREFIRQLCLYSLAIKEEYGRVDYLEWNCFKEGKVITIPYKEEDVEEAIQWAKDILNMIYKEEAFLPNPDFFYCNYLCGNRNNACEFKP